MLVGRGILRRRKRRITGARVLDISVVPDRSGVRYSLCVSDPS